MEKSLPGRRNYTATDLDVIVLEFREKLIVLHSCQEGTEWEEGGENHSGEHAELEDT